MGVKTRKLTLHASAIRAKIARLEREGHTQKEIADQLGITQPAVCKYIKQMKADYLFSEESDRTWMIYEKQLELEAILHEAEQAWRRSQRSDDEDEVKAGDAAFLEVQIKAIKALRELRGLDAPTKVDQRNANVNVNVEATPADVAALSGRPPRSDVLAEAVQREQAALPAHEANGKTGTNGKQKHKE